MKLLKLLALAPLVLLSTDAFAQGRHDGNRGRDRGSYSSRDNGRYDRGRYDNHRYYSAPRSYSYSTYAPRYRAYRPSAYVYSAPYGYYDPYYDDYGYYPSSYRYYSAPYYRTYRPRVSIGVSIGGRSHRRR